MIVAGIGFGKESIGISVVEKVYPDQLRKLFVECLRPAPRESDNAWYARLFSWTSNVLRQHRPSWIMVEQATGAVRAVALAALSQYGSQNVIYTSAAEARKRFKKVTAATNPEVRVRQELRIAYRPGAETLTACYFAVGRLATVKKEQLRAEYLEQDGRLKEALR